MRLKHVGLAVMMCFYRNSNGEGAGVATARTVRPVRIKRLII